MRGAPPLGASVAPVLVRASKYGGCRRAAVVMVAVQDLVEMQNHMREGMDRGLAELPRRHGQSGLPQMSAEAVAPPTPVSWASEVRPDAGVQNDINQVSNDANRAEQETVSSTVDAPPGGEAAAAPPIGIGSSIDDAYAASGERYADSENAFAYRKALRADCTCNGHNSAGLAPVDLALDDSLRPGDLLATTDGLVAYSGIRIGNDRTPDFTPVASFPGLTPEVRVRLNDMKVAPAPADMAANNAAISEATRTPQPATITPKPAPAHKRIDAD